MKPPLVVWALQAPTLLNQLAKSTKWRLQVANFGSASHLDENRLLADVPAYDGTEEPVAVFLSTAEHLDQALCRFRATTRLVWVLHNGLNGAIPVDEAVAFSDHVAELRSEDLDKIHVIVPAYERAPCFYWEERHLWAMLNRPTTRNGEHEENIGAIQQLSGVPVSVYGQGQPNGFLESKLGIYGACSGYVSALPSWAGFGLSEHECLAAGVPVISSIEWGDMAEELSDYAGFGATIEEQANAALRLATDRQFAQNLSVQGLTFIEEFRTLRRMDEGIERFLR